MIQKFDHSKVKDPTYFKEGNIPAHSDHVAYRDAEELRKGQSRGLWEKGGRRRGVRGPNGHTDP